jgi:DNA-binding HxlR family transcriptional regulator
MKYTTAVQRMLKETFKALGDENRLDMLVLLAERERSVSELAQLTGVTEPTASHHISRLRAVGLVHLRALGTQRLYRLNEKALADFKQAVQLVDTIPEPTVDIVDPQWIEGLPMEEWERKVLRDYTANGRVTQLPAKFKKYMVIVRWAASKFEQGVDYTEHQVNNILLQVHDDFATLRRDLVEMGFLQRERGGARYWVSTRQPTAEPDAG